MFLNAVHASFVLLLLSTRGLANAQEAEEDETTTSGHDTIRQQIQQHRRNLEQLLLNLAQGGDDERVITSQDWKRQCRKMAVVPGDDSALEVRPQQEQQQQQQQLDEDEAFSGMQLQVFHVDSCSATTTKDYDLALSGDKLLTTYELVEPLFLNLGNIPQHASDYAYRKVFVGDETAAITTDQNNGLQVAPNNNNHNNKQPPDYRLPAIPFSPSSWWKWWFVFMGSKRKHTESAQDYEATGDRAFAAGSHGEVWRGRRKCSSSSSSSTTTNAHRQRQTCDDSKPLILKRLKVEHGVPLLEAGLREIYFGSILLQEERSKSLFTSYVDHFFRQVPGGKTLELWIVFEDAGKSLRSYIYEPISMGDFVMYQQSPFWRKLRMAASNRTTTTTTTRKPSDNENKSLELEPQEHPGGSQQQQRQEQRNREFGRNVYREVLRQVLESAAELSYNGIVHRDIKPSNVLCNAHFDLHDVQDSSHMDVDGGIIECVLGDFSSAWDDFSGRNLYSKGPSKAEQTQEYSPPEALVGPSWIPFHSAKPESYDSWSIGVLALELLLGTPDVFSVDQRTRVLLTNRMHKQGASEEEIQRALYLAALSQFCIYVPTVTREGESKRWPMRHGDPLFKTSMAKESCTLQDFHQALRARDPLGIGFDSTTDPLLHLIWNLLAWDPLDRMSPSDALRHPFFTVLPLNVKPSHLLPSFLSPDNANALESLMLDPRMDIKSSDAVDTFICPKCGRTFGDWMSCHTHANSRKHAKFCTYDRSQLPSCLNAHSLLPEHSNSGYCDIQGRRRTIEDFHAIQLHPDHQFYGVFDGHTGNLAAKYCASVFYEKLQSRFAPSAESLDEDVYTQPDWKTEVAVKMTEIFEEVHENFLKAVSLRSIGVMDQSGTTATILFMNNEVVLVASVGDSRAIVSARDEKGTLSFVQLTDHHVAANEEERELVKERGGIVVGVGGVDRVNGVLVLTRSIGDANLSKFLSRTPSVVAMSRMEIKKTCGGDRCFVVLASDGLYDVMSNQEVVDMVNEVLKPFNTTEDILWGEGGAFQQAAERLTQEAYVRGSTDNIGVCVVAV